MAKLMLWMKLRNKCKSFEKRTAMRQYTYIYRHRAASKKGSQWRVAQITNSFYRRKEHKRCVFESVAFSYSYLWNDIRWKRKKGKRVNGYQLRRDDDAKGYNEYGERFV